MNNRLSTGYPSQIKLIASSVPRTFVPYMHNEIATMALRSPTDAANLILFAAKTCAPPIAELIDVR